MPTPKKIAEVKDLTERLERSNAVVLMHYRELKVKEITDLRSRLRPNNVEIKVAKNTLLRIAANNAGKPGLEDLFTGPTAAAFVYGSEPQAAKAISDAVRALRKDNVKITGGILGTARLNAADIERLGTMKSREDQLATLLGTLQAPAAKLASTLNGAAQQLVYTLMAYQEKLQAQQA